jgi:hypothetical protein
MDEDDVELSLLRDNERQQAANGLDAEEQRADHPLSSEDKRGKILRVPCKIVRCAFLAVSILSAPGNKSTVKLSGDNQQNN